MTTYTKSELQEQADQLKELIEAINIQARSDFTTNKISQEQFSNIDLELQFLDNQRNRLNTQILITDFEKLTLGSPANQLVQASEKLKEASEHLDEIRNFLLASATVINVITSILLVLAKVPLAIP